MLGCQTSAPVASKATTPTTPSPAQIRQAGNHLVGSASAYLLEHSHNPVDWHPWGQEALDLATKLDRPLFVSIGYVSCHWCHVMEREVFENDEVAAFLNAHFVAVKVDREERPDLDAVYMDAVQTLTGSGGWPMSVFLTPSLRPFFGGTYFPREQFLRVIHAVEEQFRTARNDAESRGAEVSNGIATRTPSGPGSALSADVLHDLAKSALATLDETNGGFRSRTKFPTPIKWRFLVDAYRKWGDPELGAAIQKTLDVMANGGIHDHVGGGFFRYATEPTWTIPHFEKMLYDNAQLAALYLGAAAAFDDARYRAVARDTLDFVLRDMRAPEGGFGSSLDADTAGKEGATYLFTPSDVASALGDDAAAACTSLGITPAGNFDGSNVPTRRGALTDVATKQWEKWQPALLAYRARRAQPFFDRKMVTAWNGLAIGASAVGYRVLHDARYLEAATAAAAAIWKLNRGDGALTRASDGGRATEPAILDDYAFLASGLVDLFEASGDLTELEHALTLVDEATTRFADPAGGFFLTSGAAQEPLGRRIAVEDEVEPSGSAVMVLVLERLAALTGKTELSDRASLALHRYADAARERGLDMAGWLSGALLENGPFYELVVAGKGQPLVDAWNRLLPSWASGVVLSTDAPSDALEQVLPVVAGKTAHGRAVAYVCTHGACKAPTSDPTALGKELLVGWTR
jgi:hypothetical protein